MMELQAANFGLTHLALCGIVADNLLKCSCFFFVCVFFLKRKGGMAFHMNHLHMKC